MFIKRILLSITAFLGICGTSAFADSIGIVNFGTCITDSKYGKYEQEQLENLKKQWSSLIEDTDKQMQEIAKKLENKDYLESISQDKANELQEKHKTLNEDLAKYQSQLYQMLNQANYFFVQKMFANISKASSSVAKKSHLSMIINKEAFFYSTADLDVTNLVIDEMNKNFEQENISKNEEQKENVAQQITEEKK